MVIGFTTVINYYDILSIAKYRKTWKKEQFFINFVSEVEVLDFDRKAAEEESVIMGRLLSPGKIFKLDILVY